MKKAVLLDFDGVLVDSIHECYEISRIAYSGFTNVFEEKKHKDLFYSFRWLVRPAQHYLALHKAIAEVIATNKNESQLEEIFHFYTTTVSEKDFELYEYTFFKTREFFQQNISLWLNQHSLTEFGKTLQNKPLEGYHVVTTKNKKSVELLLQHFQISIDSIYDKEDFRRLVDKGKMIDEIMKINSYSEAIFIDDSVKHLEAVNNPNVKVYFADWGYDNDPGNFEIYKY